MQDAERCLHEEMSTQQRATLLSRITAFRGYQARLLGDYEQGVPMAQQALELIPDTEELPLARMLRLASLLTAASAYLVDGDVTPATEHLVSAAVTSARAAINFPAIMKSISNLARLQLLQGRLHQAAVTMEQATQLVPQPAGLHTLLHGADYYLILGELLREWNQLDRAERHLALARLQQACGQGIRALQTLDAFAQLAQQRGFAPILLAHGAAVRSQQALAQGNLTAAYRWAETIGVSARDDLSYHREREYLALARVRIVQGRAQPMGSFLPETLGLLERLLEDAEPKARMGSVIEILLLRALALQAQGKQEEALRTLGRALALAEAEGYIRFSRRLMRIMRKSSRAICVKAGPPFTSPTA